MLTPYLTIPWIEFYLVPRSNLKKDSSNITSLYRATRSPRNGWSGLTSRIALITKSSATWTGMMPSIPVWMTWESKRTKSGISSKYSPKEPITIPQPCHSIGSSVRTNSTTLIVFRWIFWPRSYRNHPNRFRIKPCCTKPTCTRSSRLNSMSNWAMTPRSEVVSQPKIAMIDYITYVLGACGTWFGFSFLILNPAPFVEKSKRRQRTFWEFKN